MAKRQEVKDYLVILVVLIIVAAMVVGCMPADCGIAKTQVKVYQDCMKHGEACSMSISDFQSYHYYKDKLEQCNADPR